MNEFQLLEKLLNMVGAAGDGAFYLAMVWMARGYFQIIMISACVILVVLKSASLFKNCIIRNNFIEELARYYGKSTPLYKSEMREILDDIKNGKKVD